MNVTGDECSLRIGDSCPYFSLSGTDGKIYSLSDLQSTKCSLIYFTSNHCPICKAYEDRFLNLVSEYLPLGLKAIAICSNDATNFPEDTFEEMKKKNIFWGNILPYLQDSRQVAAKAFDARCTPEMFIFDDKLSLSYHGTIDNNWRNSSSVKIQYAKTAIENILAGIVPQIRISNLEGCSIKWSE